MIDAPRPARPVAPAVVLRWAGEIDLVSAPELADEVASLALGPGHAVVVDLSDVVFMDSTGLNVLVQLHRRVLEVRGSLSVRSPRPQVRHLLELTGMSAVLSDHERPAGA